MQEREYNQLTIREYKIKNKEEKEMRKTKQGVSLIVLVITIIIMIILASAIIITLSNSDIIDRANEAVEKTDLQEVQNIASIAWSEAYLDGKTTKAELQTAVESALTKNKVNKDNYIIDVTTKGVKVELPTLGGLIKSVDDYGKTVDYTVTVDGVEHKEWQVYYEDTKNGYVFLILKDSLEMENDPFYASDLNLTTKQKELYDIFNLGKTEFPITYNQCTAIEAAIVNYASYANITNYGDYVIGAIAGPTLELLAAGYNAKYKDTIIIPVVDRTATLYNDEEEHPEYDGSMGYFINEVGTIYVSGLTKDDMYLGEASYTLISPSACAWDYSFITAGNGIITHEYTFACGTIRPVVCLSSNIPAKVGTTTDFSLVVE